MANMSTGDEDGVFGLTVDFEPDDFDNEPVEVKTRVTYRFVEDLSTEDPSVLEDPEWDPNDTSIWLFDIEARAVGNPEWVVVASGGAGALPEAVAIAVFILDTQIPGETKRQAKHRIGTSLQKFQEEFADAFDVRVGNQALVPDDLKVESVDK